MNKFELIISALALVLGLSQCKKPTIPEYTGSIGEKVVQNVTLTASHGNNVNSNSKVSYNGEGLDPSGEWWVLKFKWDANDKIVVYDSEGYCGTLDLVGPAGSDEGQFSGKLTITKDSDVKFYYFGKNVSESEGEHTVDFNIQTGRMLSSPENQNDIIGKLVLFAESEYQTNGNYNNVIMGVPFSVVKIKFSGFGSDNVTVTGMEGTGFTVDNKGILTVNNTTQTTFIAPGTDDFLAVFMPTESSTTYGFNNATGYALSSPWDLVENTYYTKEGGEDGEPVLIISGEPAYFPADFTVSAGNDGIPGTDDDVKVKFSKANLQYLGTGTNGDKTPMWRLAEHQWHYMGDGPESGTTQHGNVTVEGYSTYNTGSAVAGPNETDDDKKAARDVFGWGATGYWDTRSATSGTPAAPTYQKNFQPYSTSSSNVNTTYNYFGYGPDHDGTKYNLTLENKSDWGCNPVYYGSYPTTGWRTLSIEEWLYLFGRTKSIGSSNKKLYGRGVVNGVHGLIILPDNWDGSVCTDFKYGETNWGNLFDETTATKWSDMEAASVVFLPSAGRRHGSGYNWLQYNSGYYWSTSYDGGNNLAYCLYFTNGKDVTEEADSKYFGFCVRLVHYGE